MTFRFNRLVRISAALLVLSSSVSASAAQSVAGATIGSLGVHESGGRSFLELRLNEELDGAPTCHTAKGGAFAIDLGTEKGQAIFKLATAALLSGSTVNVQGLNSCETFNNRGYESVSFLTVNGN